MYSDGHGKVHGRFTLDSLTGAMLKKALFAFAAPRHRASHGPLGERLPTPERLGQAFTELIQRYPAKKLPKAGGLNATVVVLMPLETLMGGLKAAHLDTGETISPGQARRLACEAGIIPAVLGGNSQVLDLGRGTALPHRSPTDRRPPSNNAAAPSRAATGHPACATCTTRPAGPTAARPTATAS